MNVRDVFRGLAPPLLVSAVKTLVARPTSYTGPFPTWAAAKAAAGGYEDPQIIARVRSSVQRVLHGEAEYEQDGVAFHEPAPATPVLSGLLLAAALDGGELRVLDYGGSLASHYLKWRRFFEPLASVCWDVVEQPGFVAAGKALFDGTRLPVHFHGPDEYSGARRPNAVLLGSVLQYLEDPIERVASLCQLGARLIIIDRTPFAADGQPRILVQHVSPRIYSASYPMHVLSWAQLESVLSPGYECLDQFGGLDAPAVGGGARADFLGSIWLKRAAHA